MTVYSHRPHKDTEDLQEFTEPDCTDMEGIKPFFEGHDRYVCVKIFLCRVKIMSRLSSYYVCVKI